jgi:glycerol-3-phosphate acyltransferase PlsY
MTDPITTYLAALAVGYLLGSIPFGLILTRLGGTTDIRAIGSGNIGATNVLRTGRKDLAVATLLLDMLKGTAAVVLVDWLWGRDCALVAGFGAFIGHVFPVWLGFKGGKAVATYIGVLIGLAPWRRRRCCGRPATRARRCFSSCSPCWCSSGTPRTSGG